MIKKILCSGFLVSLFFAGTPSTVYAGFGASPATLFKDNVLPGSTFSQEIIVSRSDPDDDLHVIIEPDLDQMEGWLSFPSTQKVLFPKNQNRLSIPITVNVPKSASVKSYRGAIRLKAIKTESQDGISVAKGARVDINYVVSTNPVKDIEVKTINIQDVKPSQPIYTTIVAENKGNTDAWPSKVTMDIYDLKEKLLESLETTDLSVNTGSQDFHIIAKFSPSHNLESGDYIAQTKVFMGSKVLRNEKLLFKVLGVQSVNAQEPDESSVVYQKPKSGKKISSWIIIAFIVFLIVINIIANLLIIKIVKPSNLIVVILLQIIEVLIISILFVSYVLKTNSSVAYNPEVKASTASLVPTGQPAKNSQLSVNPPANSTNAYHIYESPDINSKVLFTAVDGQQFEVIEERAAWYKVTINSGLFGWLPKSSVISRQ